jgi:hypothetical protein
MMGGMTLLRRGNAFCAIGFGAQIVPFFAELCAVSRLGSELVRPRATMVNAPRAHLADFSVIAPAGGATSIGSLPSCATTAINGCRSGTSSSGVLATQVELPGVAVANAEIYRGRGHPHMRRPNPLVAIAILYLWPLVAESGRGIAGGIT